MAELTREAIEAANARGRIIRETQPHAAAARYDAKTDRVIVDLTNGATFAFPPRLVEGLQDASPAEIAEGDGGEGRADEFDGESGCGAGEWWEATEGRVR